MKRIIAIVGLMGVGKTTIGAKLARKMRYYFIDCDQEIEDREHKSISEIFGKSGEEYFRKVEKEVIKEVVMRDEDIVLSLGGGAFMNEETRKILKERATTIWLYASLDEILYRIGNKNTRPLLNNKNKRKILEDLMVKRYPIYAKSDFKFDTANQNYETIIKEIIKTLTDKDN